MNKTFKITKFSLAKQSKSTTKDETKSRTPWKAKLRSAGAFLAGLILPSIGVIIAWGLWTSLFLYDYDQNIALGWVKNDTISKAMGYLVTPGITWLIPILIGFNGGRMVYGIRGGFIATFVVTATIAGGEVLIPYFTQNWNSLGPETAPTQFIGAMLLGPLSAWVTKKIEKLYLDRVSQGFEMLVKNFGMGVYGLIFGAIGFWGWSPIIWGIQIGLTAFIRIFSDQNLTWILGVFTEPLKVCFLNNALNHGILAPIGYTQVDEMIKAGEENPRSIYFLFDPNPGPGLGLLLAYGVWSKGQNRANAWGSTIIHFFGGIHEVYFVFILSKPIMVLSTTTGVVLAQLWILLMGGGTVATPSPGSIFTLIALSPGVHALWVNLVGVAIGTVSSFVVASIILLFERKNKNVENLEIKFSDEGIQFISEDSKNHVSSSKTNKVKITKINNIVVACEAGMGSSAMAVGIIKKILLKESKYKTKVTHSSIKDVPESADIIVTMKSFEPTLRKLYPKKLIIGINSFVDQNAYNRLINLIKEINKNEKK